MKILICCAKHPTRKYLVDLLSNTLINEITSLVNNKKHSEAIFTAFSKGSFVGEVYSEDLAGIEADLILSESNARWDLC